MTVSSSSKMTTPTTEESCNGWKVLYRSEKSDFTDCLPVVLCRSEKDGSDGGGDL
ncbi:hypothetical protein Hanom_Chr09g00785561 [Helianthus anomalus]